MRALVTGANGDIGYAIAEYLLSQGLYVAVTDKSCDKLKKLASTSSDVDIYQSDFTSDQSLRALVNELCVPFDVFVYAAGIREICPVVSLSIIEWQNIMAVNLTAAFLLSQHLVRLSLGVHSPLVIIYISSISGLYGEPERSAYCSSKHGLIGLAKSMAIELAPYSIRVNVIAPGIIDTELTHQYKKNPEMMFQLNQNIPLKRWGKPHHIVQTVDFIMKNDYLTGSTLVVDGGWTAGKKI